MCVYTCFIIDISIMHNFVRRLNNFHLRFFFVLYVCFITTRKGRSNEKKKITEVKKKRELPRAKIIRFACDGAFRFVSEIRIVFSFEKNHALKTIKFCVLRRLFLSAVVRVLLRMGGKKYARAHC